MVIRMRHTRSHTKNRRSHHAIKAPMLSECSNCGLLHRPHHMCLECGYYRGKLVIDVKAQKAKRAARMKAKKEAVKGQGADASGESSGAVAEPATVNPTPGQTEK